MRWLVYLLALDNAAFLYANVQAARQPPSATPASVSRFDNVTTILLLAEVPDAELRRRGEPEAAPPADAVASAGGAVAANAERAGAAAATSAAGDEDGAATAAAGSAVSAGTGQCFSIGPIGEPAQVSAVQGWLGERALAAGAREGKRRELNRYWVHLPAFPTLAAARAAKAALDGKGVRDLHVIERGNMANTLSLGVYRQRESMERRVQQLRGLGEQPLITERFKSVRTTWLDGRLAANADFPATAFESAFPDLTAAAGRCNRAGKLLRLSALPKIERPAPGD